MYNILNIQMTIVFHMLARSVIATTWQVEEAALLCALPLVRACLAPRLA